MAGVSRLKSRRLILSVVAVLSCSASLASAAEDVTFPSSGASLLATLEGISPPRSHDYTLMVLKTKIYRMDVDPVQEFEKKELRSSGAEKGATYAVATMNSCTSKVDLQRFETVKRNWYVVVDDKLVAWDHHYYESRCVVWNAFQPASGDLVETERKFLARVDRDFPPSMGHDLETYNKGMSYLAANRLSDAEAMLAKADLELDVGFRGGIIRPDANRELNYARASDRKAGRERLVDAIALAKDRQQRGLPLVSPDDPVAVLRTMEARLIQEPTAEDRARMAEDATARDMKAAQKWEREKDKRLFVEVDGGWMLVDAVKLRRGPRGEEKFVDYEEMMRIKAEGSGQ